MLLGCLLLLLFTTVKSFESLGLVCLMGLPELSGFTMAQATRTTGPPRDTRPTFVWWLEAVHLSVVQGLLVVLLFLGIQVGCHF